MSPWKYCISDTTDVDELDIIQRVKSGQLLLSRLANYPIFKTPIKINNRLRGDRLFFIPISADTLVMVPRRLKQHRYQRFIKNYLSHFVIPESLLEQNNPELDEPQNIMPDNVISDKFDNSVAYYDKQLIILNSEQLSVYNASLPLILEGPAGTGKTMVLFELALRQLSRFESEPNLDARIIIVAQTQGLVNYITRLFDERLCDHPQRLQIECMLYTSLISKLDNHCSLENHVGFDAFAVWHKNYLIQKGDEIKAIIGDAQKVYEGFREISAYKHPLINSKEDDLLIENAKRSLFSPEHKSVLLQCYDDYKNYLCAKAQWNSEFYTSDKLLDAKNIDMIIADEAQLLSGIQWLNLRSIAKNNQVAYAGDSSYQREDRQSLYPLMVSLFRQLGPLFLTTLKMHYRCPKEIVHFAQELIRIRNVVAGGTYNRNEVEIDSQSCVSKPDSMNMLQLSLETIERIQKFLESPDCCVITQESMLPLVAHLLDDPPLIFTPESIRGQEYKQVIFFMLPIDKKVIQSLSNRPIPAGLLNSDNSNNSVSLKKIEQGLKNNPDFKTMQKNNGRRENSGDPSVIPYMNSLVTAITRATDELWVILPNKSQTYRIFHQFIVEQFQKSMSSSALKKSNIESDLSHDNAELLTKRWLERAACLQELNYDTHANKIFTKYNNTKDNNKKIQNKPINTLDLVQVNSSPVEGVKNSDDLLEKRFVPVEIQSRQSPRALNEFILSPLTHPEPFSVYQNERLDCFEQLKHEWSVENLSIVFQHPMGISYLTSLYPSEDSSASFLENMLWNKEYVQILFDFFQQNIGFVEQLNQRPWIFNGLSAVHLFAKTNCYDLLKLFLENGGNCQELSASGLTPLYYADIMKEETNQAIIQELVLAENAVDKRIDYKNYYSIYSTYRDFDVKLLHPDEKEVVYAILANRDIDFDEKFQNNESLTTKHFGKNRFSLIHLAAQCGHSCAIKSLIKNGANFSEIQAENFSALYFAVSYNQINVVKILLDYYVQNLKPRPSQNHPPLTLIAADRGYLPMFELLLKSGFELISSVERANPLLSRIERRADKSRLNMSVAETFRLFYDDKINQILKNEKLRLLTLSLLFTNLTKDGLVKYLSNGGIYNDLFQAIPNFQYSDERSVINMLLGCEENIDLLYQVLLENSKEVAVDSSFAYRMYQARSEYGLNIIHVATLLGCKKLILFYLTQAKLYPSYYSNLLETKANQLQTPFHVALTASNLDMAKFLIRMGVNVFQTTRSNEHYLYLALKTRNFEFIDYFCSNEQTKALMLCPCPNQYLPLMLAYEIYADTRLNRDFAMVLINLNYISEHDPRLLVEYPVLDFLIELKSLDFLEMLLEVMLHHKNQVKNTQVKLQNALYYAVRGLFVEGVRCFNELGIALSKELYQEAINEARVLNENKESINAMCAYLKINTNSNSNSKGIGFFPNANKTLSGSESNRISNQK